MKRNGNKSCYAIIQRLDKIYRTQVPATADIPES